MFRKLLGDSAGSRMAAGGKDSSSLRGALVGHVSPSQCWTYQAVTTTKTTAATKASRSIPRS